MLTKNPKNASAPTSAPAASFDYSKQQWREIKAAAQPVWKGALPREERENLVYMARWYLAARHGMIPNTRREQQAWRKIVDKTERLRQDILNMAEQHLEFLKNAGRKKWHQSADRRWFTDNFCAPLRTIRDRAQEQTEPLEEYPLDNPRSRYEFDVLEVWQRLGGELRLSRHPKTGKIQGPLAKFFRAATIPVMGDSAPSLESLPNIVQRQKRFVASLGRPYKPHAQSNTN